MKVLNLILFACVLFFINSCVPSKTYTTEEKKMKIGEDVFVVKKDGKKIYGEKILFLKIRKGKATLIKVGEEKIDADEVVAYQDKDAYHIKFDQYHNQFWPTQLKRGKINLYYFDGPDPIDFKHIVQHFVFQKGNDEPLEPSKSEIASMLEDNKEAYGRFVAQFGSSDKAFFPKQLYNHPQILFEIIDIYNGDK